MARSGGCSQLENTLLNLCLNARDAMPGGGLITIETANHQLGAAAAQALEMSPGQYLVLSVSDTGTGMTPEIMARVFEPFFTSKSIGEGTGLELSMIYGFAQQSGGQVRIESQVGCGTSVRIYLPRYDGNGETADGPGAALPVAPAPRRATVFVVDDEPSVRMLLVDMLEEVGYTVMQVGDSATGLQVLNANVSIDLLINDIGLPGGMNGRQMAEAGRQTRPDLKVLFVTGYAETTVMGAGQLDGGMTVMTKPFNIAELISRVQQKITF